MDGLLWSVGDEVSRDVGRREESSLDEESESGALVGFRDDLSDKEERSGDERLRTRLCSLSTHINPSPLQTSHLLADEET